MSTDQKTCTELLNKAGSHKGFTYFHTKSVKSEDFMAGKLGFLMEVSERIYRINLFKFRRRLRSLQKQRTVLQRLGLKPEAHHTFLKGKKHGIHSFHREQFFVRSMELTNLAEPLDSCPGAALH